MHDVAAAEDQNAFFSKERQTLADLVVERRWLRFINAELNYWNISLWIDVAQN